MALTTASRVSLRVRAPNQALIEGYANLNYRFVPYFGCPPRRKSKVGCEIPQTITCDRPAVGHPVMWTAIDVGGTNGVEQVGPRAGSPTAGQAQGRTSSVCFNEFK